MKQPVITALAVTAAALATTAMSPTSPQWERAERLPLAALEEGQMVVEWSPGKEAVVKVSAESDVSLDSVCIVRPDGEPLLDLTAGSRSASRLAGLDLEFREDDLDALRAGYAEGRYGLRAVTVDGELAVGTAELSFELPPAPRVLFPRDGMVVQAGNVTVSWVADAGVEAYEIEVEQGENDGLVIRLPPEQTSLRVPFGLLARGLATTLDVVAIAANGNRTVTEIEFFTHP